MSLDKHLLIVFLHIMYFLKVYNIQFDIVLMSVKVCRKYFLWIAYSDSSLHCMASCSACPFLNEDRGGMGGESGSGGERWGVAGGEDKGENVVSM